MKNPAFIISMILFKYYYSLINIYPSEVRLGCDRVMFSLFRVLSVSFPNALSLAHTHSIDAPAHNEAGTPCPYLKYIHLSFMGLVPLIVKIRD